MAAASTSASRAASVATAKEADLLIAAAAERHGVTVLHYDGGYDMIAAMPAFTSVSFPFLQAPASRRVGSPGPTPR